MMKKIYDHAEKTDILILLRINSDIVLPARFAAATPSPTYPPSTPKPVRKSKCKPGSQFLGIASTPPQWCVIFESLRMGSKSIKVL